jgi:hypothetical protein
MEPTKILICKYCNKASSSINNFVLIDKEVYLCSKCNNFKQLIIKENANDIKLLKETIEILEQELLILKYSKTVNPVMEYFT